MTTLSLNYNYWEFWAPYDPASGVFGAQAVTIDGLNKLIYINPEVTELSVKTDIYSNWKEWLLVRDNSRFLPAFRAVGGDPITGTTEFTGDTYFLINGWRIVIDHGCQINGVLYSDDFDSPYIEAENTKLVLNKVAALVQTVSTGGGAGGSSPSVIEIREEMDANSVKLEAINTTINTLPDAVTIATQVRTELSPELAHILTLENGLTEAQATMMLEMYELLGLDPTKPLVVTENSRTAGDISQTIATTPTSTTVSRN